MHVQGGVIEVRPQADSIFRKRNNKYVRNQEDKEIH